MKKVHFVAATLSVVVAAASLAVTFSAKPPEMCPLKGMQYLLKDTRTCQSSLEALAGHRLSVAQRQKQRAEAFALASEANAPMCSLYGDLYVVSVKEDAGPLADALLKLKIKLASL